MTRREVAILDKEILDCLRIKRSGLRASDVAFYLSDAPASEEEHRDKRARAIARRLQELRKQGLCVYRDHRWYYVTPRAMMAKVKTP